MESERAHLCQTHTSVEWHDWAVLGAHKECRRRIEIKGSIPMLSQNTALPLADIPFAMINKIWTKIKTSALTRCSWKVRVLGVSDLKAEGATCACCLRLVELKLTNHLACKRCSFNLKPSRIQPPQHRQGTMDPGEALMSNQKGFEHELEKMITDILSGSSASTSEEVSPQLPPPESDEPQATPRKRPASSHTPPTEYSPAPSPVKRAKLEQMEQSSTSKSADMHPARTARLKEQPSESGDLSSPKPDNGYTHFTSNSPAGPTRSATTANAIPLGLFTGRAPDPVTWSTLHNTIQRQWYPRKTDLEYEELLRHRRNEKLSNVDRYVPIWSPGFKPKPVKKQPFRFEKLPGNVQDQIFDHLLVSAEPISIEFNWLRPFVKGHARVPVVTRKLQCDDGTAYLAPISWTKLFADVESMNGDMVQFKGALETRGVKTKGRRSPARYLTTGLLRVSRDFHKAAARVFYGQNTFHFSSALAAWMQLESFLETIGPKNVNEIRHIRIAAPMFYRGMKEDYVEGAILDLMSPATRMAVIKPPPRDRLLSAITHATTKLLAASSLETLAVDLEHPMASDLWSGRYVNDKRLISVAEAGRHVERKTAGVAMLKQASDMLTATGNKPTLTLRHFSKASRSDINQFRSAMSALITEAETYGWRVHTRLEDGK